MLKPIHTKLLLCGKLGKNCARKFPPEINALINDTFIIITTGAMLIMFPFVFMYRGKRQERNE